MRVGYAPLVYRINDASAPLNSASPATESLPTPEPISSSVLEVRVPDDATVFVRGIKTNSTGALRRYASNQLAPGQIVECDVRAEVTRGGERFQQTKSVRLQGGGLARLTFDFDNPETSLTLMVPGDAIVYLDGKVTSHTGPVRTFRTTRLAAGQQRTDFPVRVSVERNGQWLSKEQRIRLKSGDATRVTFSFEAAAVATAK